MRDPQVAGADGESCSRASTQRNGGDGAAAITALTCFVPNSSSEDIQLDLASQEDGTVTLTGTATANVMSAG